MHSSARCKWVENWGKFQWTMNSNQIFGVKENSMNHQFKLNIQWTINSIGIFQQPWPTPSGAEASSWSSVTGLAFPNWVIFSRREEESLSSSSLIGLLSIVCLSVWLFWLLLFVYWISFNTCAESFAPPSLGWIRFSLLNVCNENI